MRRGREVALAVAVACAALGSAACAPAGPRIAFVGSTRAAQGARLAVRAVREHGGIRGQPLELNVVYDDGGSGGRSIVNAEALASDRSILAVIGHASSTTSLAAAPTYNRANLPQLAPTTSAPVYSEAGPYSFRLMPSHESQAEFLARQVPPGLRVGVAYLNADYGRGLGRALRGALTRRGLTPSVDWSFNVPLDSVQTAVLLAEVLAGNPELLFWLGPPRALASILPDIRRQLPELIVYASESADAAETYASRRQLAGVRFVRFLDPESPQAGVRQLRGQYRVAAGMELTYDVVFTYDAVGVIAQALREGARTREDIRRYLVSLGRTRPPYQGVGGPLAFDSTRTVQRSYHLAEVTPGGVRPLQER